MSSDHDDESLSLRLNQPPPFAGDDYSGWSMIMRTWLSYLGLWAVVEKPVPGSSTLRSVIGHSDPNGDADTIVGVEEAA